MSFAGGPRHTADRSKSRRPDTTTGFETPKNKKTVTHGRLGPVQSATPTPHRKTVGGGGFSVEFLEARRRRQMRHASRLAHQPPQTLFVGGFNPFDQKNVAESIRKFKAAVAKKFPSDSNETKQFNDTTLKLVFREEDDDDAIMEEEEEEQDSEVMIIGGGDGHKRNSTIVIHD